MDDIRAYYDRSLIEEERLVRHARERDVTWRHLEDLLPASGSLLEVGAAKGRYAREVARGVPMRRAPRGWRLARPSHGTPPTRKLWT